MLTDKNFCKNIKNTSDSMRTIYVCKKTGKICPKVDYSSGKALPSRQFIKNGCPLLEEVEEVVVEVTPVQVVEEVKKETKKNTKVVEEEVVITPEVTEEVVEEVKEETITTTEEIQVEAEVQAEEVVKEPVKKTNNYNRKRKSNNKKK